VEELLDSILFEKVQIGNLELKNRFLMSAAAGWKATEEGDIMDGPVIHYEIAKGGPAMIINGGVSVHASGRLGPRSAIFNDDRRIPSFERFAQEIHEGGAAVAFQLTHSGLWAGPYQIKTGSTPFAPSFLINDAICNYMSAKREECPAALEQILDVARAYGDAAARAKRAGYDAVEVHAAHDSLLSQFLSPLTNIRKDDWGGSLEKRCRLHCEVLAEIRSKVGTSFPVIMKLGVKDGIEGGLPLKEGITAAEIIAHSGDVDALEVSQGLSGSTTDFNQTSIKTGITSIEKEGYYREWTKMAKDAVADEVLMIMQGGLRSFELMEHAVLSGEADLVSMCRPYLRETAPIKRWLGGERSKATCISCNKCVVASIMEGKPLQCAIK
jgi:2,4-dienoyl-CoA reductase-like NADH-dependent reductase (Old Yellow Enzyme family)